MSVVESNMMALGTEAPDFKLLDTVSGESRDLASLKGEKATVIMFICNHCPFVIHINSRLVEVADLYLKKGVSFVAISSNNVETHPQDGPDHMKTHALAQGYPFPYLYDQTQEVAKAYGAECTPDIFVFDGALECVYRGRFDNTRPNKGDATGEDLIKALNSITSGETVSPDQFPSMGCNIKWK